MAADEAARRHATQALLCIVNRVRARHGKRSLRSSKRLTSAASGHSAQMIAGRFFSHRGADGSGVRRRVTRTGYTRRSRSTLIGETLVWGSGSLATPVALIDWFMHSPQHRRTLLSRRYRDIGIGFALGAPASGVSGPAATLTLDFARRRRR